MLARKEAVLTGSGSQFVLTGSGSQFINQELLKTFGTQSLESVKGQRKRTEYKHPVDKYVDELAGCVNPTPVESDPIFTPAVNELIDYFPHMSPSSLEKLIPTLQIKFALKSDRGPRRKNVLLEIALLIIDTFPPPAVSSKP